MTEMRKPDPTDPADPGGNDAPKPQPDESFLAPGDAAADATEGAEGDDRPDQAKVPPPPD